MAASVDTALACPTCGSDRVRRRFSFVAGKPAGGTTTPEASGGGGCGCGSCTCGA